MKVTYPLSLKVSLWLLLNLLLLTALGIGFFVLHGGLGWDALAATWFGYRTLWVNRYQLPFEELGTQPTRTGTSLRDVLSFF